MRLIGKGSDREWGLIPVLIVTTAIGILYGILSVLRFEAYNSGIYDLGVTFYEIYIISHGHFSITGITAYQASRSIMFILAPMFGYYGKMPALLVFQSFILAAGGIPLYFISRNMGSDQLSSSLISISYVIFYPLAGVAWFDFHFMATFPTVYLIFLALMLYGRGKAGLALAILCFSTDPLAPAIVGITAIVLIMENRKKERFPVHELEAVLALSFIYYAVGVLVFSDSYISSYLGMNNVFPVQLPYLPYTYILYLLLPVLFLSLIGIDYFAAAIPFFLFIFLNNYQPYFNLMFYQYPALIAPVVFVSASMGLARLHRAARNYEEKHSGKRKRAQSRTVKSVAVSILILNVILFSFLTPAGNLFTGPNDSNVSGDLTGLPYSYNTVQYIAYQHYDSYLRDVISMVPKGSSVMIEDNLPQMSYGYKWYLPEWITPANLPKYAIIDPYSRFYDQGSYYGSNISNCTVARANMLYSKYGYGLVAEIGGIVLMERGYTGTVKFTPLTMNFSYNSFKYNAGKTMKIGNDVILEPDNSGGYGFYGPYTFFVPGRYIIHLNLLPIGDNLKNQNLTMQLVNTSVTGTINIDTSLLVNLSSLYPDGINISVNITGFQSLVEFRSFYMHTLSPLIFYGAEMTEVQP